MSISPFECESDYQALPNDPFRNGRALPVPVPVGTTVTLRVAPSDDEMPTWTNEDQEKALARGWGVFETMESGPVIQRWDDLPIFLSDDDAVRHVRSCQATSPLCRKATLYLGVAQREWHDEHRIAA